MAHALYLALESLLTKTQSCQKNPQESYTERKATHKACGYSLNLVTLYDSNKNTQCFYRGKDCVKKSWKDLKDQEMKIINLEERKMIPLTDDEKWKYKKQKLCHICEKEFCNDKSNESEYKIYQKFRDHCHYSGKFRNAAHSICNLRYKIQREIPVVLHNDSKYNFHLLIRELAEEFKGNIDCLGENTEKYITFSVPLKKINKSNKLIAYKLKFIDSFRFMNTSLASFVDNLSEIGNINCKKCMERN